MLRTIKTDTHIHTCLPPCGDLEMSPQGIVRKANEKNIDILDLCDHNSAESVPAPKEAATPFKINVLAGIEITSEEEVHVLGLFDSNAQIEFYFGLPLMSSSDSHRLEEIGPERLKITRTHIKEGLDQFKEAK